MTSESSSELSLLSDYPEELLSAICGLGCLFTELGYFAKAEKIFDALAFLQGAEPPVADLPIALCRGILKLEMGAYGEALEALREVDARSRDHIPALVATSVSLVATGEIERAREILLQIKRDIIGVRNIISHEQRKLIEALVLRCGEL